MDTKIDSTHAYMLALMLRSSSLAHKLLMPMLMLMLASLGRTGLYSGQLIFNEVSDDEYRQMVEVLNKEQKQFFYHVLHLIKTSDHPFYCFLSGGASVGKSLLTKALYEAAFK